MKLGGNELIWSEYNEPTRLLSATTSIVSDTKHHRGTGNWPYHTCRSESVEFSAAVFRDPVTREPGLEPGEGNVARRAGLSSSGEHVAGDYQNICCSS